MKNYILIGISVCLSSFTYSMEDISTSTKEKGKEEATSPKQQEELNQQLFYAAISGDEKQAKKAIEAGANINARDDSKDTPLITAARHNHKKIVDLLLSKGAAIRLTNDWGQTALQTAAMRGNGPILAALLTKGARSTEFANKPENFYFAQDVESLFKAVRAGNVAEVVQVLQEIEYPLTDFQDYQGDTPLHITVIKLIEQRSNPSKAQSYRQIAKLLLSHTPAFLAQKNNQGQTPVDLAAGDPVLLQAFVAGAHTPTSSK
jgi:ankyrin repeat protein